MKLKILIFFFLILSCLLTLKLKMLKNLISAKGFAYIYNEIDFKKKNYKRENE